MSRAALWALLKLSVRIIKSPDTEYLLPCIELFMAELAPEQMSCFLRCLCIKCNWIIKCVTRWPQNACENVSCTPFSNYRMCVCGLLIIKMDAEAVINAGVTKLLRMDIMRRRHHQPHCVCCCCCYPAGAQPAKEKQLSKSKKIKEKQQQKLVESPLNT